MQVYFLDSICDAAWLQEILLHVPGCGSFETRITRKQNGTGRICRSWTAIAAALKLEVAQQHTVSLKGGSGNRSSTLELDRMFINIRTVSTPYFQPAATATVTPGSTAPCQPAQRHRRSGARSTKRRLSYDDRHERGRSYIRSYSMSRSCSSSSSRSSTSSRSTSSSRSSSTSGSDSYDCSRSVRYRSSGRRSHSRKVCGSRHQRRSNQYQRKSRTRRSPSPSSRRSRSYRRRRAHRRPRRRSDRGR